MVLGALTGGCLGFVWSDVKFRRFMMQSLKDEREVLKDTLKSISETHNALVGTQARLDQNLIDLETKVSFVMQSMSGTAGKRL